MVMFLIATFTNNIYIIQHKNTAPFPFQKRDRYQVNKKILRFPVHLGHAEDIRLSIDIFHPDQQGPPGVFVAGWAGFVKGLKVDIGIDCRPGGIVAGAASLRNIAA